MSFRHPLLPSSLAQLHPVFSHIREFSLLLSLLLIQPPKRGTAQQLHPSQLISPAPISLLGHLVRVLR